MSEDPARARFIGIQALRWLGVVLAIIGMLALNGRGLPHMAGYVLAPVGLLMALVAPILLSRRWRSRNP
jgi:hypothetical protein